MKGKIKEKLKEEWEELKRTTAKEKEIQKVRTVPENKLLYIFSHVSIVILIIILVGVTYLYYFLSAYELLWDFLIFSFCLYSFQLMKPFLFQKLYQRT